MKAWQDGRCATRSHAALAHSCDSDGSTLALPQDAGREPDSELKLSFLQNSKTWSPVQAQRPGTVLGWQLLRPATSRWSVGAHRFFKLANELALPHDSGSVPFSRLLLSSLRVAAVGQHHNQEAGEPNSVGARATYRVDSLLSWPGSPHASGSVPATARSAARGRRRPSEPAQAVTGRHAVLRRYLQTGGRSKKGFGAWVSLPARALASPAPGPCSSCRHQCRWWCIAGLCTRGGGEPQRGCQRRAGPMQVPAPRSASAALSRPAHSATMEPSNESHVTPVHWHTWGANGALRSSCQPLKPFAAANASQLTMASRCASSCASATRSAAGGGAFRVGRRVSPPARSQAHGMSSRCRGPRFAARGTGWQRGAAGQFAGAFGRVGHSTVRGGSGGSRQLAGSSLSPRSGACRPGRAEAACATCDGLVARAKNNRANSGRALLAASRRRRPARLAGEHASVGAPGPNPQLRTTASQRDLSRWERA